MPVQPIPDDYQTATPYLIVRGAARAIEFYKQAFGAEEVLRLADPPARSGTPRSRPARRASCWPTSGPKWASAARSRSAAPRCVCSFTSRTWTRGSPRPSPPAPGCSGTLEDPFGHLWTIATHKEDVPREEVEKRFAAFLKQQGGREAERL
jgi:PhnB protein